MTMKNVIFWDIKSSSYFTGDTLLLRYRVKPIAMWDFSFSRRWLWRMSSSGMWRRVVLVTTNVSKELSASIIRMIKICELGTTLGLTSNRGMLRRNKKTALFKCKAAPRGYRFKHYAMKTYWGSGCIDPCFLDLGTSWRCIISLKPRPLYRPGNSCPYSLDRRLGGPQSRSGLYGSRTPTPRSSSS
jgi:hypothetical protein